jgi:hypothetical protein
MAKEHLEKYRFQKGQSGNPSGRPKGSKSRSAIVKYWLEATQKYSNPITNKLELLELADIITLAQIEKAKEGDTSAYKELMDSAYGKVDQNVNLNADISTNKVDIDYTKLSIEELQILEEIAIRHQENQISESSKDI